MASNIGKFIIQVNNIPWTVGNHQLALYFSKFGYVRRAHVMFDKRTGLHLGYGYLRFLKKEHYDAAVKQEHTLEGKNLFLSPIKYEMDLNNDILN